MAEHPLFTNKDLICQGGNTPEYLQILRNPTEIPADFLQKFDSVPIIQMEMKGTRITKTILKRLNELGELPVSDFKTNYKAT